MENEASHCTCQELLWVCNFIQFLIITWIVFLVNIFIIWKYKEIFPSLPSAFLVLGLRHVPQCCTLVCFVLLWEIPRSKTTWREGFLFCSCLLTYTSQSQSIVEGSQGKNSSVAGTWRWELKQRPWRNSTCCLAPCGYFSLGPPAWSCTTHSGLAPPVSNINQENALQAFPTAQSDGGSFSIDFLFFPSDHVTLTWVKLAKNCQYN